MISKYLKRGDPLNHIVLFSGSPHPSSRTEILLKYIESILVKKGYTVSTIGVTDFPPEDLLYARLNSPAVENMANEVEKADGIIIGSPVYKATYSGVLKTILDLLPENSFQGKPVLPFLVGGTLTHLLAIEYSLSILIRHLKGIPTQGIYFPNDVIQKHKALFPITEQEYEFRLKNQLEELFRTIELKQWKNTLNKNV